MASKRKTPELKLNEEEPLVLSRDFNLFYRPQEKPLPAGTENFIKSLDNFITGAGTSMVIASEVKQKKEEGAKAIKDYAELKTKFRKAIKEGKIKKEANPYYLEKYQQLSLNSYASEFSDVLLQAYTDENVASDITAGAFDKFYAKTLEKFVKDKDLGTFDAMTLEKGFFKETSAYRDQLEATHKSNLINNFKKDFDNKVKFKVIGVIQKWKNYDENALNEDGNEINIFERIAADLQTEIQSIIDVTDDGRASIDVVFDGLKLYVEQTTDYDFAKTLISKIPELLVGGTGASIDKIGRIKAEKNDLLATLNEKVNEKLNNEIKVEQNKTISDSLKTFDFLKKEILKNPDFNVTTWKNEEGRTNGEILGAETFLKKDQYDGGNSDNGDAIIEIETLLRERKFIEASEVITKHFENGDIRKSTFIDYQNVRLPNAWDYDENVWFDKPIIAQTIYSLQKTMETGRGKDRIDAGHVTKYLKDKMFKWLKAAEINETYIKNPSLKEDDFEKYFIQTLNDLKEYGGYAKLFGEGGTGLSGTGTVTENIEARIKKEKDEANQNTDAQVKHDLETMPNKEFEEKYGMTKSEKKKELGL